MLSEFSVQGKYRLAANHFKEVDDYFETLEKKAPEEDDARRELVVQYAEHCVRQARLQVDKVSFPFVPWNWNYVQGDSSGACAALEKIVGSNGKIIKVPGAEELSWKDKLANTFRFRVRHVVVDSLGGQELSWRVKLASWKVILANTLRFLVRHVDARSLL